MKVTEHGARRLLERTTMWEKDVVHLLSNKAYIHLGSDQNYSYLLFYSLPDSAAKIAVVNVGNTHLISVWNEDFLLPEGIKEITRLNRREAKYKSLGLASDGNPTESKPESRCRGTVKVLVNRVKVFEHDCGLIPLSVAGTRDNFLSSIKEILEILFRTLDGRPEVLGAEVVYDIWYRKDISLKSIHHIKLSQDQLRGLLEEVE